MRLMTIQRWVAQNRHGKRNDAIQRGRRRVSTRCLDGVASKTAYSGTGFGVILTSIPFAPGKYMLPL